MFETQTPRIYSIESGVAFVDMLAARLIDHTKGDPLALAEMRILLPTRRACRALSDAFLRLSDGGTVLLGGIKRLAEGRSERGVPMLAQLPYISRLFKNVGIGRDTESLMMMVTPRIIIQEEEEKRQTGITADDL